jgi:acyl carrier protein
MDEQSIREIVLRVLGEVAPEVDLATVDPHDDVREQLDLDSMDILNLAIGLFGETGVEVPERDYAQIVTVDGCVDYLAQRLAPPA